MTFSPAPPPPPGLTELEDRLWRRRDERLLGESLKLLPRSLLRAAFARRNEVALAQAPGADTPGLDRRLTQLLCRERPANLHLDFSSNGARAQAEADEAAVVPPPDALEQAARLLSLLAEHYQPVVARASFAQIAVEAKRHPRVRFVIGGVGPRGAEAEALRGRVTALGELGWGYLEKLAVVRTRAVPKWDPAHASAAFFTKLWSRAERIVAVDCSATREDERAARLARAERHAAEHPGSVVCVLGVGSAADGSARLWTERHFGATAADRAHLLEECDVRFGPGTSGTSAR
jgi:hypothetical protein